MFRRPSLNSIRARIALGFGLILIVLGALGVNTTVSLRETAARFNESRQTARLAALVGASLTEFQAARLAGEGYVLTLEQEQLELSRSRMRAAHDKIVQARPLAASEALVHQLAGVEAQFSGYGKVVNDAAAKPLPQQESFLKLRQMGQQTASILETLDLALSAQRDRAESIVDFMIEQASGVALWVTVVALLVGIAISFALARSLSHPIRQMTGAMLGIAGGDLSTAIPAQTRDDELGAMAKALEVFKTNVVRMAEMRQAQEDQERRAAASRKAELNELATRFERSVLGVVDRVSTSARELTQSSGVLIETAAHTTQQTAQVARQAEDSAHNVATVASASEELSSSISEIAQQAARSAAVAQAAETRSRETSRTVTALSEAAQRIGRVVTLISTIAEQTNLLALNATIEAARAGEAGRGFAVVASEVKSLAGQTAKATEEIGIQIQHIQAATAGAVDAIQAIAQTIEEVSIIATSIAAAVEEQRSVVDEIGRSTSVVAASTQAVNENISTVQGSTRTTVSAAEQSRAAAEALRSQAQRLEEEVAAFLQTVRAA
jgi:methyl-accepting chemotaxis protein